MGTLILAPHVDDEAIGCWSYLSTAGQRQVSVAYFEEVTWSRLREANEAARRAGFYIVDAEHLYFSEYQTVLVPSIRDSHAAHRRVNQAYREHATHFYSVDMVNAEPLKPEVAEAKRAFLNECYPSQQALWERDHRYFLFESITERDFAVLRKVTVNNYLLTFPYDLAPIELKAACTLLHSCTSTTLERTFSALLGRLGPSITLECLRSNVLLKV